MFFNYLKRYGIIALAMILILFAGWFWFALRPVDSQETSPVTFAVVSGDGFGIIADHLAVQGLVRSSLAFKIFLLVDGAASSLQPGLYHLSSAMSGPGIVHVLVSNSGRSVGVTIPEGSDIFEIDRILSGAGIISPGSFISAARSGGLEGRLFPDTYQFIHGEAIGDILKTFTDDFDRKAAPLFVKNPATQTSKLIIASILEKEAPTPTDQRIIAGIIERRLAAGMSLDIDATVCYAKQVLHPGSIIDCASLTRSDFAIDSPYNTYLHHGLPPGPIGNPGTSSIEAALQPTSSPYTYYLSAFKTGKIIYAKTLSEQTQNIQKYLK